MSIMFCKLTNGRGGNCNDMGKHRASQDESEIQC